MRIAQISLRQNYDRLAESAVLAGMLHHREASRTLPQLTVRAMLDRHRVTSTLTQEFKIAQAGIDRQLIAEIEAQGVTVQLV